MCGSVGAKVPNLKSVPGCKAKFQPHYRVRAASSLPHATDTGAWPMSAALLK
jgi:hypothetical protein